MLRNGHKKEMETVMSFYLPEKLMFCMFFLHQQFVIKFLIKEDILLLLVFLSAVIGLIFWYNI